MANKRVVSFRLDDHYLKMLDDVLDKMIEYDEKKYGWHDPDMNRTTVLRLAVYSLAREYDVISPPELSL